MSARASPVGGASSSSPVSSPFVAHVGADHVVEQRAERLEHEVQCPSDQKSAVAELTVLAHPPYPGREGFLQEQVARELRCFPAKFLEVGVLVTAVEPAQEVAPVDHVEREHPGRFEKGAHREASTLGRSICLVASQA